MSTNKTTAKKTIVKKSSIGKKGGGNVPKKGERGFQKAKGGKKAPTVSTRVKKTVEEVIPDDILDIAEGLYSDYLGSISHPFAHKPREPFRVEANGKTTKNFLRGDVYNVRGIKIGSYRKDIKNDPYSDSSFEVSFVDKVGREAFESRVKSCYDVHGSGDFSNFLLPAYHTNDYEIGNYLGFLFDKKYPTQVEDFIEQATQIHAEERSDIRT